MDDAAHLDGVAVEQAKGGRLCEHYPRQAVVGLGAERVDGYVAVGVGRDRDDVEPGHGRGGRIGAMGGVGYEHLAALSLAAGLERRADREHTGQLPVGSREGREAHRGEAGDLGEVSLEAMDELQRALHLALGLLGVGGGESRKSGHGGVHPRGVLHGAGAERVEVGVDGEVELAQVGEVLDHLRLGNLGQV